MSLFAFLRARRAASAAALLCVLCALAAAAVSASAVSAAAVSASAVSAAENPPLLIETAAASDAEPSTLLELNQTDRDLSFPLEGGKLHLNFKPGSYMTVVCEEGVSLAADAPLPRLRTPTRVGRVYVRCAPPPAAASYRALLARLGVQLVPRGNLTLALPPAASRAAPLAAAHLAGLRLDRLTLTASSPSAPPAAPRADLLRGATDLRALELRGVPMSRDALDAAPTTLTVLVGLVVAHVPASVLERVTMLEARDTELESNAPLLHTLSLTLRGAPPSWVRFPALRTLSLTHWVAGQPAPWADCAVLHTLRLTSARAEALPALWLAACGALRVLELQSCRVGDLPATLLEGAGGGALEWISLRYCNLSVLPQGLLDAAPSLLHLDLTGNKLHELPSGLFAQSARLQKLVLARNKFEDASVFAEVGALRGLAMLDLSLNLRLRDACPGDVTGTGSIDSGDSPLRLMRELTALNLSSTSVSRVCRDWRENMPRLHELKLSNTNITRLSFNDLQHKRDSATSQREPPPSMELYNTPLAAIEYSAEDELRAASLPPARFVVHLSKPLRCDCRMFRCARALHEHPRHLNLRGALLCAGALPRQPSWPLMAVQLDEMLCASTVRQCPERCTCAQQERGKLPDVSVWRVRVTCERVGLRALPPLPAVPNVEWDLRLAENKIEDLDGLPGNLTILDLRNNSLSDVSPRAAVALHGVEHVWLAGNPLRCNCALLGAAGALRARNALVGDAECEGRELVAAVEEERARCAAEEEGSDGGALLGGGVASLGAVLVAALAAGAALASPARRVRVKATLISWGWLPRAAEPDDGRPYDAFVSFSAKDEAAARRIVAELEAGARPLRLCLHSRDWTPGEYIGAQIAASVRNARRTLVLVSRHFLASGWARAEFREAAAASARAAAPHLVLVFLEPPDALPLDRELRRFLETNTYIEASNPNFWKLLRRAMPPPRDTTISAKAHPTSLEPQSAGAEPLPAITPEEALTPAATQSALPSSGLADAQSPPPSPTPAGACFPPPAPGPTGARLRSPSPAPTGAQFSLPTPGPAGNWSPPPSPAPKGAQFPPPPPGPEEARSPPPSPAFEETSKSESSSDVSESSSCTSGASWESLPRAPPVPPPAPWVALTTPKPTPTPA